MVGTYYFDMKSKHLPMYPFEVTEDYHSHIRLYNAVKIYNAKQSFIDLFGEELGTRLFKNNINCHYGKLCFPTID